MPLAIMVLTWQLTNTWKEWHKMCHADVSRWLTLGRHRCRWILLSTRPSVHLSLGLGFGIVDKSLGRNHQHFGMQMYPDDLPSVYRRLRVLLPIRPFVHHNFRFLRICWRMIWKEWHKILAWWCIQMTYPWSTLMPMGMDIFLSGRPLEFGSIGVGIGVGIGAGSCCYWGWLLL